jgi:glycosyltransferase involved in cell wall biosynthesis
LDTLIRAAIIASKEIPSLRLSVVDGSQGQKGLTEMCNRLGMSFDKLVVQRCVPHEQIGEFLASLDVAVLLFRKFWLAKNLGCESTRFSEFLGAGCPVIASDVPGSPSYPLSQRGLFIAVPPEDPQALSEALVKLYRDAALRRRIGAAAQQYAFAERTWLHIASRIEGLIASVAKQ